MGESGPLQSNRPGHSQSYRTVIVSDSEVAVAFKQKIVILVIIFLQKFVVASLFGLANNMR